MTVSQRPGRRVRARRVRRDRRAAHRRRTRAVRTAGDRGRGRRAARATVARWTSAAPYEQSFRQCINLWEDHPDVRPLTFHPRLGEAAATLLRVDSGAALARPSALQGGARPRDRPAPGPPLLADPRARHGHRVGAVRRVRRWRRARWATCRDRTASGSARFVNIFAADDAGALMDLPEVRAIEPVWVEVPRGSVSRSTTVSTVHMAKPNTTDHDRAVHTVIYFADGCTRRNASFHFSVDRDAIDVGAPIAGACTPIVWPRAAGDAARSPAAARTRAPRGARERVAPRTGSGRFVARSGCSRCQFQWSRAMSASERSRAPAEQVGGERGVGVHGRARRRPAVRRPGTAGRARPLPTRRGSTSSTEYPLPGARG